MSIPSIRATVAVVLLVWTTSSLEVLASASSVASPLQMRASLPTVLSPDDNVDVTSLMFTGNKISLPKPAASEAPMQALQPQPSPPVATNEPPKTEEPFAPWEGSFAAGVLASKKALGNPNLDSGTWVGDEECQATVPEQLLKAEKLLKAVEEASPESAQWKEKTAERALRVYYHAKWLAERNYAKAAEHRYREAARLAQNCRRAVLASHALARLGYFLIHWRRTDEAAPVLQESMKLNTKSNPLAPYLHGVLERKVAGGDLERLKDAEDLILKAGEQPSADLEAERGRLVDEISYWREAEKSSRHCGASNDVAYVLICFFGHVVAFLQKALFR